VRAKDDASSHYIHNTSGFNLWVRSMTPGNTNRTINDHAIVPSAQRRVRNTIKENGGSSCKLNITTATSGTTGNLTGVWSPDCAGSYPAAN
jgi:hypothetical protein